MLFFQWRKKTIIAIFVERFKRSDVGGVKSYIRWLVKSLNASDKKTVILTQLTKDDKEKEEEIDGLPIIRLDCGNFIDRLNAYEELSEEEKEKRVKEFFKKNDIETTANKMSDALAEFITKNKPQVIHFHNSFFIVPYALYFYKQKYDKIPPVSFYFWTHSPSKQLILPNGEEVPLYDALRSFQNLFKGIFSVSKTVYNQLLKYGIKNKHITIGVDKELFIFDEERRRITREKLDISENACVILYTGRIIKEKGLDLLPTIYQELLQRNQSFLSILFLIVGDGDFKEKLIKEIETKNLSHRFRFVKTASNEELVDYYSCADCFIFPTRREALGLSMLEAMSCSLPVIASDLPSTREIIDQNRNGILVPLDNKADYLRWISSLFSNKKLRKELGEAARKTIEEKFDSQKHFRYFTFKLLQ